MHRRAFSALKLGRVPSLVRRSNSYKSGVCVSRRVATMGVKVGGVESPESHRRLDLQINGSGFHEAFTAGWKKDNLR